MAAVASLIAVGGIVAGVFFIQAFSRDLPSLEQLETYEPRLTTNVLDHRGRLIKEFFTERRVVVPLDSLSHHLIDAAIATEDRRFYEHWGVDPLGIARAVVVNVQTMSAAQGASTITQQLARHLHLHLRQTLDRKIREAITAVQIERTYAKDEILAMYFTQMYFGHGAYGVEAASGFYFGKTARELTLSEAALLVGLLKAPNNYTPVRYPDRARERRNVVLANMRDAGFITSAEHLAAVSEPVTLVPETGVEMGQAPYFTEWVRTQLETYEEEYGFDYYRDGLTVHTTLDSTMQAIAEAAVDSHLVAWQTQFEATRARGHVMDYLMREARDTLRTGSLRPDTARWDSAEYVEALTERSRGIARALMADSAYVDSLIQARFQVQVAFIAMDPATGDVRALIGGRDFRESKFNRAVQAERQPGSVFKPFVYTTAIDNGIYGNYRILNMVQPVKLDDGTWWRPENYDTGNRGEYVTLREALRKSLNNVTVRMVAGEDRIVPIRAVIQTAHRMGIRSRLQPVPALALGANGVIPLDVCTAYGVFATGGVRTQPRAITRIEDRNGQEVLGTPVKREVVLSAETAAIMTNLLSDVINRGTGGSARWRYKFYAPAAGKTGTTNNFNNAWFAGFTPELVAVVWVGFDDPSISLGPGQAGSVAALPIWARFMRDVYQQMDIPRTNFGLPVNVVEVKVDAETGMAAGPLSSQTYTELFRRGDEPPQGL